MRSLCASRIWSINTQFIVLAQTLHGGILYSIYLCIEPTPTLAAET